MIVYVFYGSFFKKLYLPSKVVGIYPFYLNDNKLLFNIESNDGKWYINVSDRDSIYEERNQVEKPELKLYTTYVLNVSKINLYLVATPLYNENSRTLSFNGREFIVGGNVKADICLRSSFVQDAVMKLTYDDSGYWIVTSNTNNVYLNDSLVSTARLLAGDVLFCFGFRLISLGRQFIISGPDTITINNSGFVTMGGSNVSEVEPKYDLAEDTPLYDKKSYFSKSPRFINDTEKVKVFIESPPPEEKANDLPPLLTLGPQLTMLSMSLVSSSNVIIGFIEGTIDFSKFIVTFITVVAMMSTVLVWPLITKNYNNKAIKKKERKRKKKYLEYLDKKKNEIEKIKNEYRNILFQSNPSLDTYKNIIMKRTINLWDRSIDDEEFLKVWLGIGTVESNISAEVDDGHFSVDEEDKLITIKKGLLDSTKYVDECPYTFNFTDNIVTGIIGEKEYADRLVDNVLLQIMTFHAYSDLKIIVYTQDERRWEYLKILPHCWNNQHATRFFATSIEELNEIFAEFDNVFDQRRDDAEEEQMEDNGLERETVKKYKDHKPYYLIFTDSIENVKGCSLIKKILNYKKNLGFSLMIENDRISSLPDQTSAFISVGKTMSGLFSNKLKKDDKNEFRVDFTTPIDMYYCAQLLANIPIELEKGKYELPKSLSFLQMFNVGRIEQLNSLDRWKNNNPVNSLSVPLGIDQNGEVFKMDIHEKVHGPHGLVAGTTGSGKSEWIVTYILSLAVNFNPDELQFVLVDYKGGGLAMSFENHELGIKLPHLAGTITNLDKSAINRSIASIESELKRRQSIFNAAREKLKEGQMDIYKYQRYYRKGMVEQPLSHLLIICDEFAELKSQQPEFMDQLISTARIGRSLGVHLILATQKPSGVVNDQIWSNSRFKVCLRVQDKADSNEILKKPDAAYLKQTGAFYLEVGNDEYYNLGQAAWAGAKYYPSDTVKHTVDQSIQCIDNIGKIVNYYDDVNQEEIAKIQDQGEELLNIVKYIDGISKEENFVKQQLWLPNIPEVIYLADIKKKYSFKPERMNFTTVIGEYDEPRRQEQNILTLDLAAGNIAIVGQPGCGKEQLLSTIIFSSLAEHTPQEINYYIFDFGAETLRKFSKFPHVGEVVFQDDMERVGGVIQMIFEELTKRKELFQDYNGSLEYYNKKNPENQMPLIVFVVNAFDVFGEVLPRVIDSFTNLFRDSPRYGIISVLAASAQNTFRPRVLQYFNRFILMNLQDESQYRTLANCRKGLIPSNLYGRGICKTEDDDDSYCEFQTAKIIDPDKELVYLTETADKLSQYYKTRAKKIATIPDNITSDDLAKFLTTISDLPLGYNFYEKDIAKLDLEGSKFYPIITKDVKANLPFVYALANLLSKIPNTVVRVIDVLGMFEKPILDIKLFNEDLRVVFAAISKDVETRTDTQPLAFNIILGAGSIKGKMDKTGQEFVDKMFNGAKDSKQNIFILLDDYKKFKLLKLQPWFANVDTTNGLWLGPGIDSQSIISSNELATEDKKYNYPGMAFLVKDSNYTLIKTMMDGDD